MKRKLSGTVWPSVMWSIMIFILLIIPGKKLPDGPDIQFLDKIVHAILFGIQVWLWGSYFKRRENLSRLSWILLLVFMLSSLYGIGMEYVQKYFVTNRAFELGDIIADIAGSAIGAMIAFKWKWFR